MIYEGVSAQVRGMIIAEGEGFEPPETCASAVFKQGVHKPLTCSDAPEDAAAPQIPHGQLGPAGTVRDLQDTCRFA